MSVKGYKVFNPDWTCRGFQYEVGKTYEHKGDIEICEAGFHFCQKAAACFNYYSFDCNNKVAEVEAIGKIKTDGVKSVTDKIKIIKELKWSEVLELVNIGKACTGINNSGDRNSGNRNSGDWNSGDRNSGNRNSGDWNSGNRNSGNWNSGDRNSGDCNSGDCNSGNWNSGDCNSGFFNTQTHLYAFNKPLNIHRSEFLSDKGVKVLNLNYRNTWWIFSDDMTEKEKEEHPEHEIAGGYLKTVPFKEACKIMWNKLTVEGKEAVKKIPNFDSEIFKEITGIDVNKEE